MRTSRQSFDQASCERDETSDDYSMEGVFRKTKRYQLHHPRRDRFRSPSPFQGWEDGIDTAPPSQSQSSEKETDSQLPYSEGQDSQSDVDWESLLCEDIEMLPQSNWEADFLAHQARIMACSDYRRLQYDELIEGNGDEPWHPYDPESMIVDSQMELHSDSANDELGDKIICYGVVSPLTVLSCKRMLYHSGYRTVVDRSFQLSMDGMLLCCPATCDLHLVIVVLKLLST